MNTFARHYIILLSGAKPEVVLRQFGEYFFEFCKRSGYDHMLRTLGGNLFEFTENLDALHSYLALSYKVPCSHAYSCGLFLSDLFLILWRKLRFIIHCLILAGNECTVISGGEEP